MRQDARLGRTILATGDGRIEHQLQADMAVQKKRPGDRALGNHAWLKSIVWGKDDVLTAHHFGSAEAAHDEDGGPRRDGHRWAVLRSSIGLNVLSRMLNIANTGGQA